MELRVLREFCGAQLFLFRFSWDSRTLEAPSGFLGFWEEVPKFGVEGFGCWVLGLGLCFFFVWRGGGG